MSEMTVTADSSGNFVTRKYFGIPGYMWIGGVALLAYFLFFRNKSSSSDVTAQSQQQSPAVQNQASGITLLDGYWMQPSQNTTSSAGTSTTTGTGTDTGSGSNAANPANNSTWSFPAPGGLRTYDVSKTGYRLEWSAVAGPSGQKPASYTVATYNSGGKEIDKFTTTGTSTSEYGKGGKGLAKGTYHTEVWANGGPVAPPHSTVTQPVSS